MRFLSSFFKIFNLRERRLLRWLLVVAIAIMLCVGINIIYRANIRIEVSLSKFKLVLEYPGGGKKMSKTRTNSEAYIAGRQIIRL